MMKKATQPPTPSIGVSKKTTTSTNKAIQKGPTQSDRKNESITNDFRSKDDQLLGIVKEYLQFNGYMRSYEILKSQKPNLKVRAQLNQPQPRPQLDKNHLLQLFDRGNREEFFRTAHKMLSSGDEAAKRLEFQLNIYFCIYNIHPFLKKQATIDKPSVEAFKKYLDTKGAQMSGTSQYLSFFALPFIQKPQEHGALAHVFTREWLAKTRNRLIEFHSAYLKNCTNYSQNGNNTKKICSLQQLYQQSLGGVNSSREECKENCTHLTEIDTLKEQGQEMRAAIENYQRKFQEFAESSKQNLMESNQKWFNFSREIYSVARKYVREDKLKFLEKYNSFFGGNIDDHIEANEISLFDKNSYNQDLSITPDLSKQKISMKKPEAISQNYQIDLGKIRTLFLQANLKEKQVEICIVLKALRVRFTKKVRTLQRRETIIQYSRGDLCGISEENYVIQKKLLFDGGERIKEFYVKLMEVITTDVSGLQYLTRSKRLIENLVAIFNEQNQFGKVRKPVLGILQRLSFSREPRLQMISLGIIPMIFKVFHNEGNQLSSFTVQFMIAMMMNLSLKRESRKDFEQHKTQLIGIVAEYMDSDNNQIRNYVNGAIFLLLTSKEIKAEALRQKLDQVVKNLLETREDDMCSQQYNYILNRLTGNQEQELAQDSDSDEEEEVQNEQCEEDEECGSLSQSSSEQQYIQGDFQIANGDQLLMKNYALLGPEAVREQILTRSVLDETSKRINNMTTSINRSRRLDNIFAPKGNATVLQPQLDCLLNRKR